MATKSSSNGQDGAYYRMARSHDGSARLTLQHFLWKTHFGWSLHPELTAEWSASSSDRPFRIADVACGNGVWAIEQATIDLAKQKPVEVVGFDISEAQFPGRHLLPDNVKLETWSIFEEPPEKYHEYFDVVHVRLILAAIANGDPTPVLRNLLSMLRPGGGLQWSETDVGAPDGTTKEIGMVSARDKIFQAYGKESRYDWISKLDHIFTQHEMMSVSRLASWPQLQWRKYWWDCLYQGLREVVVGAQSEDARLAFDAMEENLVAFDEALVQTNAIVIGRKA